LADYGVDTIQLSEEELQLCLEVRAEQGFPLTIEACQVEVYG